MRKKTSTHRKTAVSGSAICSPSDDVIRDLATRIANELDATINGRTGNSAAHKRMHSIYKDYPGGDFASSAVIARATWVEEEIRRSFGW